MSGFLKESGLVKATSGDSAEGPLLDELVAGSGIALAIVGGADKRLQIAAIGGSGLDGYNVKASATDTTPGFLDTKLTTVGGLSTAIVGGGGNEQLRVSPVFGSAADTICEGDDARLSDSRTPTIHGSTHQDGGSDEVSIARLDGYTGHRQDGYALQGRVVSTAAPSGGQALVWNASAAKWEPGTPAASTGLVAPVPTLTALGLLPTTDLVDGTMAYVNNVDDIYYLERGGSPTPDGYDVVAGFNDGYWVSRFQGRWNDQQGDISQGVGNAALTYEAFRDTPWKLYCARHDQNDELNFRFQIDHTWRYDLPVVPHLHILPLADPVAPQVAYFDAYYAWSRPEYAAQAVPAVSGWTWVKIPVTIDPGDVYKQKFVSLGTVAPPSWVRESSILLVFVRRLGTSPSDTYTTGKDHGLASANIGLLSADVHFRRNKTGTLTEL